MCSAAKHCLAIVSVHGLIRGLCQRNGIPSQTINFDTKFRPNITCLLRNMGSWLVAFAAWHGAHGHGMDMHGLYFLS